MQYLLKYMMASAVHLMANEVHPSHTWCTPEHRNTWSTPNVHDCLCSTLDWLVCFWWHHVRLLIYMIGYADHLMANAVHPSEAPEVHPSVVPDVRWWPLQYTWWQMQYIQVKLLMYDGIFSTHVGIYSTPCEAPELHDRICSTVDGKCITPKWGSWSTPQCCSWC